MKAEETFIKQLEVYLNLEFNQFDKDRIFGYLTEYLNKLPSQKPQIVTEQKTIYKYIRSNPSEFFKPDNEKEYISVEPKDIIRTVSRLTEVSIEKIKGKDRYAPIIVARHVAMYLIKGFCHETLLNIGNLFNRDHTSVMNALKHVREMLETEDMRYIKLVQQAVAEFKVSPIKKTA